MFTTKLLKNDTRFLCPELSFFSSSLNVFQNNSIKLNECARTDGTVHPFPNLFPAYTVLTLLTLLPS
jgi:hypothetical protein